MEVRFEIRHPDRAELREHVMRRIRFALRRLEWRVPHATVSLVDVNGPRGGLDKRCQVELATTGPTRVFATALAADWSSAIETALSRAARALLRAGRRRHFPRASRAQSKRGFPLNGAVSGGETR